MKCVSSFMFLALFVNLGVALKCYHCTSNNPYDCVKRANPHFLTCGKAVQGYQSVCSYSEIYDPYTRKTEVETNCDLVEDVQLETIRLHRCQNTNLQVKECRICKTDLCNYSRYYS